MEDQGHTVPLIRTKLHRPPVTEDLFRRSRLHERMDLTLQTPLTVVSAPAGYGKSMLVSHWVESQKVPCAWLSLDEDDRDLRVFLDYFLAAIDTVFPDICATTKELSTGKQFPPVPVVAGHLVNELDAIDAACTIVLDDYHRIDHSSPVHELVSRLLEHPPRGVHVVLITRQDPPLPLASLRAGNRITEVRLKDLQFTASETTELLGRTIEAGISEEALANLQREVEGWAVGLRLVSLALRHVADPDQFLRDLRGGLSHTQEYLFQEVLADQSPEVRDCLLRSSILDRFCSGLLDAVCGVEPGSEDQGPDGRELLELLLEGNLFTVSLDARGEWFRFHHLFQDLLQRELQRNRTTGEIEALHRRASEWFETQGLITESIEHALAAGDVVGAAEIVDRHRQAKLNEDRWFIVKQWLDLLPRDITHERAGLLLARGWIAYFGFELERLVSIVERVEPLLDDRAADPVLLAELDFFRGVLLYWDGDGESSRRHCEAAIARFPEHRELTAGEVRVYLALARHMAGDGKPAIRSLEEEIRAAGSAGAMYLSRLLSAPMYLHLLSGDLTSTERASQRLITVAERMKSSYANLWGRYPLAVARLHSHRLDAALRDFRFVADRRDFFERIAAVDSLVGQALTYQLMQRPDRALGTVDELITFTHELGDPQYVTVAHSCRARISLLQGDLDSAVDWARSTDVETHAPSKFFWLEDPSVTRARVQIAEGTEKSLQTALGFLDDLQPQVRALHLTPWIIEVLVLRSLALEKQGRPDEATEALGEALALARPGGWVRPFVEAGPVMAEMLHRLGDRADSHENIKRLLAAFENRAAPSPPKGPAARPGDSPSARRAGRSVPKGRPDLDALTNRELDILELLAQRLQNKEIAARLCVSTHTVNDHLKHIYSKLGVSGRRQAVQHAVEKGILDPH